MILIGLIGLLIILRLGSRLQAPVSVGGNWSLEPPSNAACSGFRAFITAETIQIVQSGPHLVLTLDDESHTQLRGNLEGAAMQVAVTRPAGQDGIQLIAQVDRSVDPNRLEGQVTQVGCQDPLLIHATRQPQARSFKGE